MTNNVYFYLNTLNDNDFCMIPVKKFCTTQTVLLRHLVLSYYSAQFYAKYLFSHNGNVRHICTWPSVTLCKKASNHHANLPLEMYSFTL